MTHHCSLRIEERAQLTGVRAEELVSRARERGKESCYFTGRERKYLISKETDKTKAIHYNGFCFIFGIDDICITMFKVPKWFGKKSPYIGKEYIRKPKIFYRNNPDIYFESLLAY